MTRMYFRGNEGGIWKDWLDDASFGSCLIGGKREMVHDGLDAVRWHVSVHSLHSLAGTTRVRPPREQEASRNYRARRMCVFSNDER